MPREFKRKDRVSERIHRLLGELIRSEIRDPRLGFVTISTVEVSRDLAYATVFFTVLEDRDDPEVTAGILRGAAGHLRKCLGRELTIRSVPELRFKYDISQVRAEKLSQLISSAVARDRDLAGDDE